MITDMLRQHQKKEKASFHMPGHKNGAGLKGAPFDGTFFAFDTTELPGTDALIEPTGAILEAEQYAASLYGAVHSFFLVGGSTCGILAMIYTAFGPGDKVIIDRNAHQSVLNGAMLSGIKPIYITPENSPLADVPGTVSAKVIEAVLKKHPDVRGAVITSPNYYGAASDIRKIADLLHRHKALLLVDEAHGAHFPFSPAFPDSAVSQGADMSVVSLHKTLPAPNQTALLNIGKGVSLEEVRGAVRIFQTSSPSYPLLAAMEYALTFAKAKGAEETERVLSLIKPLGCPSLDDPFKQMPTWAGKGISGYMAEEILRTRFGIYVEMCTPHRILCMTSWCNSEADIALLKQGLSYLDSLPMQGESLTVCAQRNNATISLPQLSPAEARQQPHLLIAMDQAAGKICAKTVAAFPPCIPVLLPGEIITEEKLLYLDGLKRNHATLTGINGNLITVVQ